MNCLYLKNNYYNGRNFNSIENVELKKDEKEIKLNKKMFIYIIIIICSVIIIIMISFLYFLFSKDDENKNEPNICKEEKDNCLKCKNNECIRCYPYFEIIDGKSKATFSFRATYETLEVNQNIDLIYINFGNKIIKLIIDENEAYPSKNYTFKKAGIHTAYMLVNLTGITGISLMFYKVEYLNPFIFEKNLIHQI